MRSQFWPRWGWQEKNENGVIFTKVSVYKICVTDCYSIVKLSPKMIQFFFIASNPSHRRFLAHIIPEMLSMDVMMLQVGLQVKQRHSNFTGRSYSIFSKVRLACKLIALQTCSIKGFFALSLNTKLFVTKCLGISRTGYFGIEQVYDIYSSANWNCALLMLKDNDKAKRKLHNFSLFFILLRILLKQDTALLSHVS